MHHSGGRQQAFRTRRATDVSTVGMGREEVHAAAPLPHTSARLEMKMNAGVGIHLGSMGGGRIYRATGATGTSY
ncbi:hypothetical protein E2C01_072526 [Portunus trituberculatus]|uniref:Uncharacterized protein n=1 Tax=Portunus trituberculatus TaxID=210409 RepID=A0A5B7I2U0_PORTR|nr:hypothetical protein [Portunus trituberculatus]